MTADPAPRLAEIKERWRMVDRISPDDVDYVLTVAERAAALLPYFYSHRSPILIHSVDGHEAEAEAAAEAVRALSEALGERA